MDDELATNILLAYGIASTTVGDFRELDRVMADEGDAEQMAEVVGQLRLRKNLIELFGLDSPGCEPLEITSATELETAVRAVEDLVYGEYIPNLLSDSPQVANFGVMPYLDGAIVYAETYLNQGMLAELRDMSDAMTISPTVRLAALRALPVASLNDPETDLDLGEVQRAVEEVVRITDTETFEPPMEYAGSQDSLEEVRDRVRNDLRSLMGQLTVDPASDASRPNPLRTSTSYLLAFCKLGQAMALTHDSDSAPEL